MRILSNICISYTTDKFNNDDLRCFNLFVVNSAVITYNAALNRPAFQSSVHQNSVGTTFPAHYANDGRRHTHYLTSPHCALTNSEANPWWAVDLGYLTAIYRVDFTTSIYHCKCC